MSPIFLIGYMGSGKTTLGKAVAARASVGFVDLDDFIEETAGATVSEIFAREGEEGFRRREREALREVCSRQDVIVACGGGTPCFGDNMDLMLRAGTTVMLTCQPARLLSRLQAMRSHRPLIAQLSDDELVTFIDESLSRRLPHYSRATHTFDSTQLDSQPEVDATVDAFIRRFLS